MLQREGETLVHKQKKTWEVWDEGSIYLCVPARLARLDDTLFAPDVREEP